jgi:hypothetical protein
VRLGWEPEYRRAGPHGYRGVAPSGSAKEFDGGGARPRPLYARSGDMAQSGHPWGALRILLLSAS